MWYYRDMHKNKSGTVDNISTSSQPWLKTKLMAFASAVSLKCRLIPNSEIGARDLTNDIEHRGSKQWHAVLSVMDLKKPMVSFNLEGGA